MAGFGVNGTDSSGSVTSELIAWSLTNEAEVVSTF
jgi:hypothetical protein